VALGVVSEVQNPRSLIPRNARWPGGDPGRGGAPRGCPHGAGPRLSPFRAHRRTGQTAKTGPAGRTDVRAGDQTARAATTRRPDATGGTTTRTHHDDGSSGSPPRTDEGTGWTCNIGGIGGDLSAIHGSAGTITYQLASLHGDVVGTSDTAGTLASVNGTADEYGTPRDTFTIGTRRYGWLGAKQRAADTPGGLTLMGVRLYNPTTGRFLSTDPIPGGNANPYEYCSGDPVNCVDLDGRWGKWKKWGKKAWGWSKRASMTGSRWLTKSRGGKMVQGACGLAWGVAGAVCGGVFAAAYARQGRWKEAGASVAGGIVGGRVQKLVFRGFRKAHTPAQWGARSFRRTRLFYNASSHWHGNAVGAATEELYNRHWPRRWRW
jgi:RHS repeat-associated protein